MRKLGSIALACLLSVGVAHAQDLSGVCRASTSYDVTLRADSLLFQRAAPTARSIVLSRGALRVDGREIALNEEDRDRVALIERDVRALVPRVKTIARRAVDLGAQAVREEVAAYAPQAVDDPQFTQILDAHKRGLKARIAASVSTRDWSEQDLNRIVDDAATELFPIVAGDAAQQALGALTGGNAPAANALAMGPSGLQAELESRVRAKMLTLAPDVRALCPTLDEINTLQLGINAKLPGGALDLLDIDR